MRAAPPMCRTCGCKMPHEHLMAEAITWEDVEKTAGNRELPPEKAPCNLIEATKLVQK